jgi:uncharacterized protein (TIGR03067 family)
MGIGSPSKCDLNPYQGEAQAKGTCVMVKIATSGVVAVLTLVVGLTAAAQQMPRMPFEEDNDLLPPEVRFWFDKPAPPSASASSATESSANQAGDETQQELANLQGTWVARVRMVASGREDKLVASGALQIRLTIRDDQCQFSAERRMTYTMVVNPSKAPKTLDLVSKPTVRQRKKTTSRAIYKLEGNKLTLVLSQADKARPQTFEADQDQGFELYIFERR